MLATERTGATLLLTLDRPEKRNALHPELVRALVAELQRTDTDAEVRVVVITGAGQSFCAGLDLDHLPDTDDDAGVEYMHSAFELFRRVHELRQPVIAAVNGPAMAGGFDLAAFCDLRICVPEARFAQTEILLGLTQIMFPLYELIGLGRAKELALTGTAITADEAYRIGLVNRIVPREALLDEALELAALLASRPPQALFATRRLARELVELNREVAFDAMFDAIAARLASAEHRAALRAYRAALRERGGR